MNTLGRLPEKHVTHWLAVYATNECLEKNNMIGETMSRGTTRNKTTMQVQNTAVYCGTLATLVYSTVDCGLTITWNADDIPVAEEELRYGQSIQYGNVGRQSVA